MQEINRDQLQDIKGRVDFAIITVREDEFEAVLKRFPINTTVQGRRFYNISRVEYSESKYYSVVITRSPEQGINEAQNLARDIIEDLDPQYLLLVGIAGGVPEYEFTLGDVVVATRLNDFSVSAAIESETDKFSIRGGPMHPLIQRILANLPAWKTKLQGWSDQESIGMPYPAVELQEQNFYGSETWQKNVKERLENHFGSPREPRSPIVTAGTVVSSNALVKNTELVAQWKQSARHLLAVEMELAGVYIAARQIDREYPILAIRGISDIVGFRRDPGWTTYACNSAAAFASAFIRKLKLFSPRQKVNHASPLNTLEILMQMDRPSLRRLMVNRLNLSNVRNIWFDTLGTQMDNFMNGQGLEACVIELLEQARMYQLRTELLQNLCKERPDLINS